MSKIVLMLVFVSVALLGCGGGGGTAGDGGMMPGNGMMPPMPIRDFTTGTPTLTDRTGNAENNVWTIAGDTTGTDETMNLILEGTIDGMAGSDEVQLNGGATVASIAFDSNPPTDGALHLQDVETITIDGGTVNGAIDASAASAGVTFNLNNGMVGSVTGSAQVDSFVIGSGIMVSGTIDGGGDEADTLSLASGFTPASANLFGGVLTLVFDGNRRTFTLQSIESDDIDISVLTALTPLTFSPTTGDDILMISNDIVGTTRMHILDRVIDGLGGDDTLQLNAGAVVANISFSDTAPSGGDVHLRNVRTIHINGSMVTGDIIGSSDGESFRLQSGTITGNVVGGDGIDIFDLFSDITINGFLDGGGGDDDLLQYTGAPVASNPPDVGLDARGGLDEDTDITDNTGDVRNIEAQIGIPGITSLSVRNIESLALSPALNLYGALSDALMQFGQQTAQGFALADLNPQTGRLTQLISKASPFTKGRIWAHKITHSGNGKGSIGLALTGLTARAANDYDYEMSLTQHGFDAPIVSSQWGDFGLRAVSHAMTGTIETNIAEAQVSGYGAGVSLLWRSRELRSLPRHHNLTAHITALAGGYEVDAHTSPSNPQAVVNEVSEGSFSAINAVISAGIADKRELTNGLVMRTTADVSWQTLSLDDFTETGADGIVVNFDKATRFTARIGAGLESEHWFSDLAFVHETSSGGTLSSGLRQDYRQHDGTAIEMKFGGKVADLASGLTIKAFMAWRQSVASLTGEPSAQFDLSYRF